MLCPKCKAPHAYSQVHFRGERNDHGHWIVNCAKCDKPFLIAVTNPAESRAQFEIKNRLDDASEIPEFPLATDHILHDVPESEFFPSFDYGGAAVYRCSTTGLDLEIAAHQALQGHFENITDAYRRAENYLCGKSAFSGKTAVVQVRVSCICKTQHIATFYTGFSINFVKRPIETYLLADVSGVEIADRLEGLYSKSDVMSFLSKLLIRWHLTCDRIIVATPFIGHQFDKPEQKMDRWSWLLSQLDPGRATLITRPATLNAFRKLSDGDVTYDLLKRYGLENKIISANVKKQDFHAKFFMGLANEGCEILSGSANLVHGPSIENISFRSMSLERCQERYINVMNVVLPEISCRSRQFVRIRESHENSWNSCDATGWPLSTSNN